MKKLTLIIILGILVMSLVVAEESGGVLFGKQNDCLSLPQECRDCTYVKVTTVLLPNMSKISVQDFMVQDGTSFSYDFCSTDLNGKYVYCMYGDVGGVDTTVCKDFEISPNGENPNISKGLIQVVLLGIVFIFLIFSIFGIFSVENYIGRFTLYWVSHTLMIAGSFIAWNMANNFLTGTPFVIGFLRIIFLFFVIGAFPMLILSLAWIFYIHLMSDDIKRLMDRGMDEGEAHDRASRKRRW